AARQTAPPAGLQSPPGWADALATVASPGPIGADTTTGAVTDGTSTTTYTLAGQKRSAPPTPASTPGTPGTPSKSKKRPYRRTKRPAGYNDRSTVTTVTPKAAEGSASINEYDRVLAESEDLLNASLQAQKLGRLKMASAYQLLLHTRLVGMGKRVDRSTLGGPIAARQMHHHNPPRPSMGSRLAAAAATTDDDQDKKSTAKKGKKKNSGRNDNDDSDNDTPNLAGPPEGQETKMLQQLSSILPQDAEMDASMMEHLARAAAELHHQRTGRRRTSEGLLALPNPLNPLAAMTNKPKVAAAASAAAAYAAATSVATASTTAVSESKPPAKPQRSKQCAAAIVAASDPTKTVVTIDWSAAEIDIVNKGVSKKWLPETIARVLSNKNEEQVRAFLEVHHVATQNSSSAETPAPPVVAPPTPPPPPMKLSAARNKKEPTRSVPNAAGGGASASNSTKAAAASIAQNITGDAPASSSTTVATSVGALYQNLAASSPVVPEVVAASVVGGIPLDAASPSRTKSGGRGRKPATTAMNTVATVTLDIKSLLQSNSNNQNDGNK
ncbi:MAG: hypothetical protein SGILL_007944, partial [Bacillariaceae sp.]